MTTHDNQFRIYFNREEINAMRSDMVVEFLYFEIRCHMDGATCISGLHKKFSEQYFLDLINLRLPAGCPLLTRRQLHSKISKMKKLGLIAQTQANRYIFECLMASLPLKTREKKISVQVAVQNFKKPVQVIHRGKIEDRYKIEEDKLLILNEESKENSEPRYKLSTGEKSDFGTKFEKNGTSCGTSHIISNLYYLTCISNTTTSLAPLPPANSKTKSYPTHCPSRASAYEGPRVFLISWGQEVLGHLNRKTGRRFMYSGVTQAKIEKILREGASVEDCKRVIDQQHREWNTRREMKQYLRPKTLFNSENFWNYHGQLEGMAAQPLHSPELDLTCHYQDPAESAASRKRCEGWARKDGTEHLLQARFGTIVCSWHQIVLLAKGGDVPAQVLMKNLLSDEDRGDIGGNLASIVRCGSRSS